MEILDLVIFLAFCPFVIMDFVTTRLLIRKFGPSAELNPIMRRIATKSVYLHALVEVGLIVLVFILVVIPPYLLHLFYLPSSFLISPGGLILTAIIGSWGITQFLNIPKIKSS